MPIIDMRNQYVYKWVNVKFGFRKEWRMHNNIGRNISCMQRRKRMNRAHT